GSPAIAPRWMRGGAAFRSRKRRRWRPITAASARSSNRIGRRLKRLLLLAAILAGELHAARASFGLQPVRRAAFAADRLDPRVALLDHEIAFFHGLADQPLGLFPHRLFRHRSTPVFVGGRALSTIT